LAAIEHEHIEAMRAAFYRVCDALLLNGDVDDPMTEVVVDPGKELRHGPVIGHAGVLVADNPTYQLRGVGDAKVLKSLGHSPKGRHYRG
jgi:hypothetical protein